MNRPQPDEYAPYYAGYVAAVQDDVLTELASQAKSFPELLNSIAPDREDFAPGEGKWTLKELLGHVIDTERIMTYRALSIARGEKASLLPFDQDEYVKNSNYRNQNFAKLIEEFRVLREANLYLFKSFEEKELSAKGTANNYSISVRGLLFVIAGHVNHHRKIITERYL
ncbi:DinB family protein [Arcticibacter sp. MXS-1]|uniref:DinB family protein n=1 Tax=Arcticibacter sp. MXS-1 TaxID=3341726 RepID=UPI0035A856BF